ncbi:ATP-binding protein [Streptomyces sp. NPDC004838]
MIIDPTQPWGVAIDYAGRATITEGGHTVNIRVYDNSLDLVLRPDPMTGNYPSVYVTASIMEDGAAGISLHGHGDVIVNPQSPNPNPVPVPPNHTAVPTAVAAALTDFETRRAAYAALCATWAPPGNP